MTPQQAIGSLDRQIERHGQTLKFKRGSGALAEMRGFVRGFKPSELVGTLKQGDRSVILSPTTLGTFGMPRRLDKVVLDTESSATVEAVEPVRLNNVLVRVNLLVKGD